MHNVNESTICQYLSAPKQQSVTSVSSINFVEFDFCMQGLSKRKNCTYIFLMSSHIAYNDSYLFDSELLLLVLYRNKPCSQIFKWFVANADVLLKRLWQGQLLHIFPWYKLQNTQFTQKL